MPHLGGPDRVIHPTADCDVRHFMPCSWEHTLTHRLERCAPTRSPGASARQSPFRWSIMQE